MRLWPKRTIQLEEPESNSGDTSSARVPPSRSERTSRVTVGEAFSLGLVHRAISIHATAIKQLSLHSYRGDIRLPDSQTPSYIRRPDYREHRPAFLDKTVVSLYSTGNCYWKLVRDSSFALQNIEVLNPLDMYPQLNDAGDEVVKWLYRGQEFRPDEIKHIPLLRVPGYILGLGPIQAAQMDLRGTIDMRDYAAQFTNGSGVPNGTLTTEQVLTAEAAKEYKDQWNETNGAQQGVAVLGNGLTYKPVYLSPRDAQFLESQAFNKTELADLFGMPASLFHIVQTGGSDTYKNVIDDWLGYSRFSLMQPVIEIEAAFTDLSPRGQEVHFNMEALLRADTNRRYDAYAKMLDPDSGWGTLDEVRGYEKLPPLTPEQREEILARHSSVSAQVKEEVPA